MSGMGRSRMLVNAEDVQPGDRLADGTVVRTVYQGPKRVTIRGKLDGRDREVKWRIGFGVAVDRGEDEIPWPHYTHKRAAAILGVPFDMLSGLANNPIPALMHLTAKGHFMLVFKRDAVDELAGKMGRP
jgi:hypothetical protein